MSQSFRGAPHAGVSGKAPGLRVQALVISALVFVVTAITLCLTVGALLWGCLSLLDFGGTPTILAALLGIAATLPAALWLACRAYRAEVAGGLGAAPSQAPGEAAGPR